MGVKKIGDRVRIFVGIKTLRSKAGTNQKKRNRESIANLERYATLDTPSAISPLGTNYRQRERSTATNSKRFSTQVGSTPVYASMNSSLAYSSPMESARSNGYFSQPQSAKTATGRRPETPSMSTAHKLPPGHIKIIHGQQTKTIKVGNTFEEIMGTTLSKMNGRGEQHVRNYCFWVHDPTAEEANRCKRLSEKETVKTSQDPNSSYRGRLILRAIHAGEPSTEEIERSRAFVNEDIKTDYQASFAKTSARNLDKAQRMLGETIDTIREPHSPAVGNITPIIEQRRPMLPSTRLSGKPQQPLSQVNEFEPPKRTDSKPKKPLNKFMGARPPSEFISYDLTTYFPDHDSKAIERTVSMAQRRSARMSKALSRLSTASNFSVKDAIKDAPAMPAIPASFLSQDPFANTGSESRTARPLSVWRQSVASSMLQPLQEEDAPDPEPDRKSYISFGDSASELSAHVGKTGSSLNDSDSATAFFDEGSSVGGSTGTGNNTLNDQCREALLADGEGVDEELDAFLTGNTFDKFSWMQGALIGQGSFGSVYLALHAVTGELMAVKQVELPGKSGADPALDKRKESMLAALKREINLLSDLQHENIVQYLGVQATEEHLNIFLEYVPGGSVASMLNNYGHLQEPLIRNFVRQILSGLSYLHKRDIIHRDIKGANILVDNKGKVKISDFGISKKVELSATGKDGASGAGGNKRVSMQGSVFWMAPEVVKQTSYTRKADIWSMGCLVVEMFTGEHPFPKMNQMQAIFQIGGSKKPDIPDIASLEAKDFLQRTFDLDESKRPEADELKQLPFLKLG